MATNTKGFRINARIETQNGFLDIYGRAGVQPGGTLTGQVWVQELGAPEFFYGGVVAAHQTDDDQWHAEFSGLIGTDGKQGHSSHFTLDIVDEPDTVACVLTKGNAVVVEETDPLPVLSGYITLV